MLISETCVTDSSAGGPARAVSGPASDAGVVRVTSRHVTRQRETRAGTQRTAPAGDAGRHTRSHRSVLRVVTSVARHDVVTLRRDVTQTGPNR